MTKGTKAFRIIISILLAFTLLWSAFWGMAVISCLQNIIFTDEYDLWVAGVAVTRENKSDVLGDGTVTYLASSNTLVLDNDTIEADRVIIQSKNELKIELIGENKFLCKDSDYIPAIYVADYYHNKDLTIRGDGSLTIDFQNTSGDMVGMIAADIIVESDITINMLENGTIGNGIICDSSLMVVDQAVITVNQGASNHTSAVRVRGNAFFEEGTSLNISVKSGAVETGKGLSVNGDLILGKNVSLHVTLEDETAEVDECIRVTGLMDVGSGSTVTASAKNVPAIECFGSMKLGKDATVSASTDAELADIFCYGSVVNYGATVDAEIEAIGGELNKENP